MSSILLITQIILALVLTISVLLQKSSSIGLGVYSGSNESLFGAKGPAGFMAKFTMAIGLIFIINTIALGYFYTTQTSKSIMDNTKIESKIPESPPANPLESSPLTSPSSPFEAPAAPLLPKSN
ncbi:preprotein translocase subunit SecG [Helicobacter sp. 16-1353]|uniref:preprotein translocase subunit SecG n=1 Tax=Helicobacter sp. 16-1353 TaxID=2004996 RepID=UPI000DCE84A9|nr:preprotein translocase subunit SecG [Helicobacter sp. 16-1353]RAX52682.1 preprotein translocase subunit SecG [Helicobacter sp. 16-1353]